MEAIEKSVGKKFQKSYFDVLGLCCSSEIPLIEKILMSLEGVKDFSVIVPTKTVIVVHDTVLLSQIQIVKALNQARLEANIKVYGGSNYKKKWPSPYAIISGTLLLLSFLKYFYSPLQWLAIGAVAFGIPPILLKAFVAIRSLRLDINILVLIAVSGSIALHDYWEAGTIVFLFTIAEWLESRASHKATAVMSSLVNLVPQRAVLADTGEEINADEVKLNTVLAVKAGEIIPIDGVVVEGNCEVDEKILTGESFPVAKQKDSTVWASTINLNGYITIKTTAIAEDCVVARMAKLVEEAQNQKSRTQRLLDKCAKYYTPAIVVISAAIAIVPLVFHVHNNKQWYHLALVVLVSGCPCALLLSTPVAMFCALNKAATLGVLFKGAVHLETLAKIKVMAFDKTGTITKGEFVVSDFRTLLEDISFNDLLYRISSVEIKSSHPMAAALVEYARAHSIEPKPDKVENFQNFPGEGICGKIEGKEIYIGNRKLASRAGCVTVPTLEAYDVEGKSVGYVFLGSSPAGVFCLSDVCRTGAKEAITELKALGIKTAMLTGDCYAAANYAQDQLGGVIEVVHAELLPQDKGRIIKELQERGGPTAMIGDGVNDAPALATADIGISMGISGSALAKETGDIILMSNDIQRIPKAVHIAKKVKRKVIENVVISFTTKAAILGLAIAGHPLVWAAVLTDVGTCLLVIFNSMLLLRGTHAHSHEHKHKCKAKGGCSPHSHSHCSDIESQKRCEPQTCSSKKCDSGCNASSDSRSKSCEDHKKCSSSHKENDHSADHHLHHHHSHNETRANDGCCSKNAKSCGENINSAESAQSDRNCCGSKDRVHDKHKHEHGNHSTSCKSTTSNSHCHEKHCSTRERAELNGGTTEKQVRKCCEHTPRKEKVHSDCEKHASECGKGLSHHSASTTGCKNSTPCVSSSKLRSGCCESFRRECCLRKEHFIGLQEIVIES